MDYLDFDVAIRPLVDGAYEVELLRSPAGEQTSSMHLALGGATLERRIARVQAELLARATTRGGVAAPADAAVVVPAAGTAPAPAPAAPIADASPPTGGDDVRKLGEELFDALFGGSLGQRLALSIGEADERSAGLRIRLRIDAPELAMLPWEFMYDTQRGVYLTLAAKTPLVRYVPLADLVEPLAVELPLRILGIVATPAHLPKLDTARERRRLEDSIEQLRGRGGVELVWLAAQTSRYLQSTLRKGPWHVLHFIGHGGFDEKRGEGAIALADDDGNPKPLYASELGRLLHDHDPMRLVVLNACEGARGNQVDLFSSSASVLVRAGVPAVVAMQYEISDHAAIEFGRQFYEALADGLPVDTALGEARKGMSLELKTLEWGTPVLYTHAPDGVLFRVDHPAAAEPPPRAASGPTGRVVSVLCDSADLAAATTVAAGLGTRGWTGAVPLAVPDPATPFRPEAVTTGAACVVLLGAADRPPWTHPDLAALLDRRSHDPAFNVVPVLLPGSRLPDVGQLPAPLALRPWVDLRPGVDDADGLDRLAGDIGEAPDAAEDETVPVGPLREDMPYRGLEVFDEEHAEFFFGREALVQQLIERSREDRFLAVVGPSGSGKSSLVRAGFIPALRNGALPGSGQWPIVVMRPGSHPLETLAARIAGRPGASGDPLAARESALAILLQGERGIHAIVETLLADAPGDRRFVIVVDQFEEIFTLCKDDVERERFAAALLHASSVAGGQTLVVITMRADFFGHAAALPALAARLAERDLLVPPMARPELRRAIVEPARRVGLRFEPGLVDAIVADLGDASGALPLLEHALLLLWEGRRQGWLTTARYAEIGGVRGAIAKTAEEVYLGLGAEQQTIARYIFLRLVDAESPGAVTRRRVTRAEIEGSGDAQVDADDVLQRLVDGRLVTTSRDDDVEVVDLAHEALITHWPRLRDWVGQDREAGRFHRRLTRQVADWDAAGRETSYLYRGSQLVEATKWAAANPGRPSELERAFLTAAAAAGAAEDRAKRRRRQAFALVAVAAFVIVSALGAFGWRTAVDADRARASEREARLIADARAASAEGAALADAKPLPGLGRAVDGYTLARRAGMPTAEFRTAVEGLLRSGRLAKIGQDVERIVPSPDGRYAIVDVASGPGRLIRMSDGTTIETLSGNVQEWDFLRPDAALFGILYADAPGELRRWGDGSKIALSADLLQLEFVDEPGSRFFLASYRPIESADGETVQDRPSELRSLADGTLIRTLSGFANLTTLQVSGRHIAVLTINDQDDELIDAISGDLVTRISAGGNPPELPTTGPRVIFGTSPGDQTCTVWRASDGAIVSAEIVPVDDPPVRLQQCGVLSASADGALVAVSRRGRVEVRRLADLAAAPLVTLPGDTIDVAFGPDPGTAEFAVVRPGGVELWRGGEARRFAVFSGRPAGRGDAYVRFSADGRHAFFAVGADRVLVRMSTGRRIALPPPGETMPGEPVEDVTNLIFSPDPALPLAQVQRLSEDGELVRLGEPLVVGPYTRVRFWPAKDGGPVIAYGGAEWAATLGATILDLDGFEDVVFDPAPGIPLAIVKYPQSPSEDEFAEPPTPSKLVTRTGTVIPLAGAVESVDFGSVAFVVRYLDQRSEILAWDATASKLSSLGTLGQGVAAVRFDDSGQHLAVRYLTGAAVLVDLQRLRSVPVDLAGLTDAQLVDLACANLGVDLARSLAPESCSDWQPRQLEPAVN